MRSSRWVALVLAGGLAACVGTITDPGGEVGDDDSGDGLDGPDAGVGPGVPDASLPGVPDATPPDPPPDAAPPMPQENPLATGLSIGGVAIYQAVRVPLVENGSPVAQRNAPVVEGAEAMFSVSVTTQAGFSPRQIQLRVTVDGTIYKSTQSVTSSSGTNPSTTLRVRVPGDAIKTTSSYVVSLHEADGAPAQPGTPTGARYPQSGAEALAAKSSNGPMRLVLVPFRYNADGSGRLPPMDSATVAAYKAAFESMYPAAAVEVTVREPVNLNFSIGSSSSWSNWLEQLMDVRQADNPPDNHYYYGMAAPATSFQQFCSGGCVVGLGNVPSSSNSFLFASVGVSFASSRLISTALHEVGHTMGRRHVNCGGPSGVDPNYPYSGGSTGVWGWDASADELLSPSTYTDIMGYCNAQWISDYQYSAIYTRISTVNANAFTANAVSAPAAYRVGVVDAAGNVTWKRTTTLPRPPVGGDTEVSLRDEHGVELGVAGAHFFPFDHLGGGIVYVPLEGGLFDPVEVAPAGFTVLDHVTDHQAH